MSHRVHDSAGTFSTLARGVDTSVLASTSVWCWWQRHEGYKPFAPFFYLSTPTLPADN